jgi:ABC-type amino acid transport substrate-binding protein
MRGASFLIMLLLVTLSVYGFEQIKDSVETESVLQLTLEEQSWLDGHPIIKVGSDPQWAPFEFRNNNNIPIGLTRDYISIIEKKLGVKFEYSISQSWNEIFTKAKNKEVDILSAVVPTKERLKYFLFTEPYNSQPISIYALEGSNYIRNLDELKNKKVGVVKGYITEEFLKKDYPDIDLVTAKNIEDLFEKLSKNEIIAFIESMPVVNYYINNGGHRNVRIVGETPYAYTVSMGIRNDWPY